jgi:hypothetical protein
MFSAVVISSNKNVVFTFFAFLQHQKIYCFVYLNLNAHFFDEHNSRELRKPLKDSQTIRQVKEVVQVTIKTSGGHFFFYATSNI